MQSPVHCIKTNVMEKEKGQASFFCELQDGKVTVTHGTDNVVLYESEVPLGYWDKLWEVMRQENCDCNKNFGNKNLEGSHDVDCAVRK